MAITLTLNFWLFWLLNSLFQVYKTFPCLDQPWPINPTKKKERTTTTKERQKAPLPVCLFLSHIILCLKDPASGQALCHQESRQNSNNPRCSKPPAPGVSVPRCVSSVPRFASQRSECLVRPASASWARPARALPPHTLALCRPQNCSQFLREEKL